tara:strand:+ start:211 stop:597 length:387 start_codon:yes stop_codon:yes gene_type:complete
MSALGIGVDIINILRIKKSITNKNFVTRIFSRHEINISKKFADKASFFSKRFAAKEAFSKALGIGFRKNLNFKDISIRNTKYGKPYIEINEKIKRIVMKRFKIKKFNILLSISDEKNHSIAFVVLVKI